MSNWISQEINWDKNVAIDCFKRKMKTINIRKKEYAAYIYICNFETGEDLKNNWEDINSKIAVYDQSNIELLIERSNFYVCFFVKENISTKLQNTIEADTFSAKKYVFDDDEMSLEGKCDYLENRIFSINIDPSSQTNEKVKKIELQNFRAYEGRNQINLCIDDDKPASFVTIYAPNGIGKTSILDGLEYAFKGSVGRLRKIPDIEIGAIYHNRNHVNERAFVDIELESSGSILRNVAKVRDGGNDIRKNPPIKGSKLVGIPEQWEQTILPHDKIDSFITAKSGVDRYKEWIRSTNIEASISDNFSTSHKAMTENEKQIVGELGEIAERTNEILALKKQTDKIDSWKTMITYYNQENKDYQLKILGEVFEEEDYDSIINTASIYIRKDKEIINECEKNKDFAEKILKNSVESFVERLDRIPQLQQNMKGIQKKVEDRKKYDELSQKNGIHVKEVQKYEKELEPINQIIESGQDYIYKQKEEYLLRNQQIRFYNNDIETKLEQQIKYQELLEKRDKEIKGIVIRVSDEQKNYIIQKKINSYLGTKNDLSATINSEEKISEEKKSIVEKIAKQSEELKTLKRKHISKTLDELKYQDILNLSDILETEFIDNLKELFSKYQEAVKSVEINQDRNKRFFQNKKDLEEIRKSGQEYINQHQNLTECPLCHNDFFKWDKLFDAVNMLEQDGEESIQDELKGLRKSIVALNKAYDNSYKMFDEILVRLINQKNEAIDKLDNEKKPIITRKKANDDDKKKLVEKIGEISMFLEKEKINVLKIDESTIKNWFGQQDERIKELQAVKNQYQEEVNKLKKEKKKIDGFKLKQEEITKDTALIKLINFLINKSSDYDVKAEKNKLDNKIEEKNSIITENNIEISKIEIKAEETVTYLLGKKKEEQKSLEDVIKLSDECEPLKPLTKDNVEHKLNEWKDRLEHSKANIESLNAIMEESGVREYHKTLKNLVSEKETKETELNAKVELKVGLEEKYESAKSILEEKLDEYFNQTIISEVFQKIDPHQTMKNIEYEFAINQDEKPELFIRVSSVEGSDLEDSYRPECFFSSAQLNMVAFSSFFSRALQAKDLPISTIFIDDPIGHFDDINILGFSDLLRSVLEVYNCQIVLTTHDDKVFQILKRKLNNEYYSSKFIELPEDCIVMESIH